MAEREDDYLAITPRPPIQLKVSSYSAANYVADDVGDVVAKLVLLR